MKPTALIYLDLEEALARATDPAVRARLKRDLEALDAYLECDGFTREAIPVLREARKEARSKARCEAGLLALAARGY